MASLNEDIPHSGLAHARLFIRKHNVVLWALIRARMYSLSKKTALHFALWAWPEALIDNLGARSKAQDLASEDGHIGASGECRGTNLGLAE